MVARQRKLGARDPEEGIPRPRATQVGGCGTGVPGPPPLPLWPRPVRGIAGEARAHREPQGAKVEVFSPQACSDLAQLRKKFKEDKQRIELMRAQRKFRPY